MLYVCVVNLWPQRIRTISPVPMPAYSAHGRTRTIKCYLIVIRTISPVPMPAYSAHGRTRNVKITKMLKLLNFFK